MSLLRMRVLLGMAVAVVLTAMSIGYVAVSKAVALRKLDRLERRNQYLAEELSRSVRIVDSIRTSIDSITARDSLIRVYAGLDLIDADVQQAGIGGPAGEWTDRDQVLSEGPEGRDAMALLEDLDGLMRRASMLSSSFDVAAESVEVHVDMLLKTPSILPAKGWTTSGWAVTRMHPIYHKELPHEGIDVAAPRGTPILAAADGTVTHVYRNGGYGLMVTLSHGRGLVTRYAHCSKAMVERGQRVKRGDAIAEVGMTGIATAPHLHYEVLEYGRPKDPKDFILKAIPN
jgi:murein DD-endopeptidase MepM/ murein hydrolase activator NlpD